jgi:serine-type D-Ala-D-Ala carboxypeptidase (penicillin-binding protein 5/6)
MESRVRAAFTRAAERLNALASSVAFEQNRNRLSPISTMEKAARLALLASAICFPGFVSAQTLAAYEIVDHTSGYVLEAFKPEQKRQIGSLTKIAAAKVVLDWASRNSITLDQLVTVPSIALGVGGINPMGLQADDQMSYRDLIYSALLQSDNVAAMTLAYHVGSQLRSGGLAALSPVDAFVSQMNALARQLGMNRTFFVNPDGLEPERGPLPYSTATDLARLTMHVMNDAAFRFYVSQKERKVSIVRAGQTQQYLLRNTNEMLGQDGVDGVKTGKTARAGECLILSSLHAPEVRQDGATTYVTPRRIDIVILGSSDRVAAAQQLLSRGWSLYDGWAANGRRTQAKTR